MKKVLISLMIPLTLAACRKEEKAPPEEAPIAEEKKAVVAEEKVEEEEKVPVVNEEKAVECEDEDCVSIERIRAALRDNDRQALSQMFSYPLRMRVPVPTLKNSDDFLKHYDGIFDERLIEILRDTPYGKWEEVGWRGKTVENGLVWLNAGKITALNHCGPACERDRGIAHDWNNPGLIAAFYPIEEESMRTVYYLYATVEKEYLLMAFEESHAAEEAENTIYLTASDAPKEADTGGLTYTFVTEDPVYELTVYPEGGRMTVRRGGKKTDIIALEHITEPLSPPE